MEFLDALFLDQVAVWGQANVGGGVGGRQPLAVWTEHQGGNCRLVAPQDLHFAVLVFIMVTKPAACSANGSLT